MQDTVRVRKHECSPPADPVHFAWCCPRCGSAWTWHRYGPDGDIRLEWRRYMPGDDVVVAAAYRAEEKARALPWWSPRRVTLRRLARDHRAFARSRAAMPA